MSMVFKTPLSEKRNSNIPVILLFLVVIGTIIRIINLESMFLYWDEPIHSVRIDYQPLDYVLAHNNGSAFFALLVHFLLSLGKIVLMARLPSVLFGILTIFLLYFVGKYLFSRKEGLTAAAFAAFSPFLIRYSQYARGYATLAFFALLSLYFFLKANKTNHIRFWLGYTIFTTLTVYTHLAGFFTLPCFAVTAGVTWIGSRFSAASKPELRKESLKLLRFIIFTFIILTLIFLLYLPDENMRGFLHASSERVSGQNSFSYLVNYLSQKIFITQIEAAPPLQYLFLAALLLGTAAGLKTHTQKTLFIILYIFLPFFLFIAINPRSVNIQSTERYLIFLLPVMFLLMAKGLTTIARGIRSVFHYLRMIAPDNQRILNVILPILVFAALISFNYTHYYLYFWKFGSFPVRKEVHDYLRKNVKRDSLIYFDSFPVSGLTLIISPLTRKDKPGHNEYPVRKNMVVDSDETDFMIFRSILGLKSHIRSPIPLWAVSNMEKEARERLVNLALKQPGTKAANLEKHAVICLYSLEESIENKFTRLIDIFLKVEPDSLKRRQLLLLSAKINLYCERIDKAAEALNAAESINLGPEIPYFEKALFLQKGFEFLLGFNNQKILQIKEKVFFHQEMAKEFFLLGDKYLIEKNYESAAQMYILSYDQDKTSAFDISNRLVRIANIFLISDLPEKAYPYYKKAEELNPERFELSFLLAEAYKAAGFPNLAAQVYDRIFEKKGPTYRDMLQRLVNEGSTAFIWKTNTDWRLVMVSDENAIFSGQIKCNENIDDIQPILFKKEDSLAFSDNRVRFSFKMDHRRVKILSLSTPKAVKIELDLKINGKNIGNIILVE